MSNQQQGSGQNAEAERKAAEKAAAEKAAAEKAEQEKAEQERQGAAKADGVKLSRGDEVVTAYKPATITRLKSEGWTPVEDKDA